jgi:hypothetical protein
VSIVESHGGTNPVAETSSAARGKIHSLKKLSDNDESSSFQFAVGNRIYVITINYEDKQNFLTVKQEA